ncbi:serine hydrolase domain-containing protein [Neorhizobium tomejilense]|uniref:serine hydrolase domain-containing protein n=1 Tax=Neorhizobium tomejilense TaxID=2093828 RepID=UPI003ED05839
MTTGFSLSRFAILGVAIALSAGSITALAEPLDPALVEARRNKTSDTFNLLTYRHLDELFDTRSVEPGPNKWALPSSTLKLPDDTPVQIEGKETTLLAALQDLRINGIVVMRDGKIVREVHRNGGSESSRYIGFSMSKSWTSMLFGIVQEQGKIHVDDPVVKYLPDLKGTAYDKVTLRNLLTMRTGTSWVEDYSPGSFLDGVRDASTNTEKSYYEDVARELKPVANPGAKFNYSTLETELAGKVIVAATGKSIAQLMTEAIWQPAGMEAPGYWIMQGPRGRQHEWYGAGFAATLRDFARLGQIMLDDGKANGKQIVPPAWVNESTSTSFPEKNYFYFWWAVPGLDGFAAQGVGGQSVYVDRQTRTVMVIAGYNSPPKRVDLFKSVVKALNGN